MSRGIRDGVRQARCLLTGVHLLALMVETSVDSRDVLVLSRGLARGDYWQGLEYQWLQQYQSYLTFPGREGGVVLKGLFC